MKWCWSCSFIHFQRSIVSYHYHDLYLYLYYYLMSSLTMAIWNIRIICKSKLFSNCDWFCYPFQLMICYLKELFVIFFQSFRQTFDKFLFQVPTNPEHRKNRISWNLFLILKHERQQTFPDFELFWDNLKLGILISQKSLHLECWVKLSNILNCNIQYYRF